VREVFWQHLLSEINPVLDAESRPVFGPADNLIGRRILEDIPYFLNKSGAFWSPCSSSHN
jgi:hypothetical protein